MENVCSKCGASLDDGAVFCPECGAKVEPIKAAGKKFCSSCGAKLEGGTMFCPKCGQAVDGTGRTSPAPAAPVPNYQPARQMPSPTHMSMMVQPGIGGVDGCMALEVTRDWRFYGLGIAFSVYLDDTEIGKVGNNGRAVFNIPVGRHTLVVKENNIGPKSIAEMVNGISDPFVFDAQEGGYLRLGCNYTFGKFISMTPIPLLLVFMNNKRILQITPKMF